MTSGQLIDRIAELPPHVWGATDDEASSITLLIVDDDEAFATRLAAYLRETHGITAEIATSGSDAISTLTTQSRSDHTASEGTRENPERRSGSSGTMEIQSVLSREVDCVVCDYKMPRMDGLELVERIRQDHPLLPIILFAGQGNEAIAGEAFRKGADDYLQKDTNTEQFRLLANRIRAVVSLYQRAVILQTFYEAVEQAGHSIYMTDRAGVIQYVNPAFEEITGYSAEEAIGATPAILNSGVHDDSFYADLWETILSGQVWNETIVNARKDGEQYYAEQTIAPITDGSGEIAYFVAINNCTSAV